MKVLNVFLYVIIFLEAMVQLHELKKKQQKNIQRRKQKQKQTNKQTNKT